MKTKNLFWCLLLLIIPLVLLSSCAGGGGGGGGATVINNGGNTTADTQSPQSVSIKINSDAVSTDSVSVTVSLSATDDTGVTGYYIDESILTPEIVGDRWTVVTSSKSFSLTKSFDLSTGSGTKTVYVWFRDEKGNLSDSAGDSITLNIADSTAPSNPSISINSGAASTTSASVTLSLSATDNEGVTAYYASETATTPSANTAGWVNYTANATFTLSSGFGTKTVYVWFKDSAGNISTSASNSITYKSSSSAVAAAKLVITSTALPAIAAEVVSSSPITIEAWDSNNNVASGFNGTVNLSSNSTTMTFGSSASMNSNITSITLSAGKGSFYFKDTMAGTPTITISSTGLTSASQAETISCTANTHCSSVEICQALTNTCKTALNRVYRLTVKNASINITTNSVDADSSYPDPFVSIHFPTFTSTGVDTSTKSNSITPSWNEPFEVTVTADGQSLWFCVWDEDILDDDPLYFSSVTNGNCGGFSNILEFIRYGEASISGTVDVNYLNVSIAPK